jgi:hypothetical protein
MSPRPKQPATGDAGPPRPARRFLPRFGQAARRPTRVAAVRALSFDVKSGDVENLHFQEGKQLPF